MRTDTEKHRSKGSGWLDLTHARLRRAGTIDAIAGAVAVRFAALRRACVTAGIANEVGAAARIGRARRRDAVTSVTGLAAAAIAIARTTRNARALGRVAGARNALANEAAARVAAVRIRIQFARGARVHAGPATGDDSAGRALLPERALARRRARCTLSAVGDRNAATRRLIERVSELAVRGSQRTAAAIRSAGGLGTTGRAARDPEKYDQRK